MSLTQIVICNYNKSSSEDMAKIFPEDPDGCLNTDGYVEYARIMGDLMINPKRSMPHERKA